MMSSNDKIYVAGHRGMVGSAIVRELEYAGYEQIITRTHAELDLCNQNEVARFFAEEKPDFVFLAAARVGGIVANNSYPAQFIYENLQIQNNIIHHAYLSGVKKLLFLGSSCIYPKLSPQPMKEEYLLTGPLEKTNEPYAIAKIAGIKMCQSYNRQYGTNFIAAMPTNLYGTNDNFDLEKSHVLPALLRKFHEAKVKGEDAVTVWGTGTPRREFLYVDDLANACIYLMNSFDPTAKDSEDGNIFVNVGCGTDITIKELAAEIQRVTGFEGSIVWDTEKPDGTPQKLLSVEKLHALGWKHTTSLEKGIEHVYDWYKKQAGDK